MERELTKKVKDVKITLDKSNQVPDNVLEETIKEIESKPFGDSNAIKRYKHNLFKEDKSERVIFTTFLSSYIIFMIVLTMLFSLSSEKLPLLRLINDFFVCFGIIAFIICIVKLSVFINLNNKIEKQLNEKTSEYSLYIKNNQVFIKLENPCKVTENLLGEKSFNYNDWLFNKDSLYSEVTTTLKELN